MTTSRAAALAGAVVRLAGAGLPGQIRAGAAERLRAAAEAAERAAHTPPVDIVVATALAEGGEPRCPLPGRVERLDPLGAALAAGLAAAIGDPDNVGATSYGVAVAVLPGHPVTGGRLLDAVALGIEAQLRLVRVLGPEHRTGGWHEVGTTGPIAAAITAGVLRDLPARQLANAIAIASSMTLGHRAALGSPVEPFHTGQAAANGVLAATLAGSGFTGAPTALEGARGYLRVLSGTLELPDLAAELGERWELPHRPGTVAIVPDTAADSCADLLAGVVIREDR